MTVAILVPVLRRPHRIEPLLASIDAATPAPHRTLFLCTPGDDDEIQAIESAGAEHLCTPEPHQPGDYARKINLGYHNTDEPLIFLAADDLHFHSHWLERATDRLTDQIAVVGTNDLGNRRVIRGEHSTHSLVTRAYVDTFGTIDEPRKVLHEGYPHEFVDDEFIATARHRHAVAFATDSHVEHLHPNWGKAELDDLYLAEPQRMIAGRKIFNRRRRLWR